MIPNLLLFGLFYALSIITNIFSTDANILVFASVAFAVPFISSIAIHVMDQRQDNKVRLFATQKCHIGQVLAIALVFSVGQKCTTVPVISALSPSDHP